MCARVPQGGNSGNFVKKIKKEVVNRTAGKRDKTGSLIGARKRMFSYFDLLLGTVSGVAHVEYINYARQL